MARIAVLSKRLFQRRMSKFDLFWSVEGLLSDYSWMEKYGKGWIRDYLVNKCYPDGTSYNDAWKRHFSICVGWIADEPTWVLQRKKLLDLSVNANSWVALDNVVSKGFRADVAIWKECVIQSDRFQRADESDYAAILTQEVLFNLLSFSLFSAMGLICFGLNEEDSSRLTFFRDLKIYSLEKRLDTTRNIKSLIDQEPVIGAAVFPAFKSRVSPHWERENEFFRRLADDISSRKPIDPYGNKWEKMSNEYNATLQSLKEELGPPQ